jgi:hypothetical protein
MQNGGKPMEQQADRPCGGLTGRSGSPGMCKASEGKAMALKAPVD